MQAHCDSVEQSIAFGFGYTKIFLHDFFSSRRLFNANLQKFSVKFLPIIITNMTIKIFDGGFFIKIIAFDKIEFHENFFIEFLIRKQLINL